MITFILPCTCHHAQTLLCSQQPGEKYGHGIKAYSEWEMKGSQINMSKQGSLILPLKTIQVDAGVIQRKIIHHHVSLAPSEGTESIDKLFSVIDPWLAVRTAIA